MFTQNEYLMQRLNRDAYDNLSREATKIRMLRKAGLLPRRGTPAFICQGFACLGRLMVSLGRKLQEMGKQTPLPAGGD